MEATQESAQKATTAPATQERASLRRRKCACGKSSGLSGDCEECQERRFSVQRYSRNREIRELLSPRLAPFSSLAASLEPGMVTRRVQAADSTAQREVGESIEPEQLAGGGSPEESAAAVAEAAGGTTAAASSEALGGGEETTAAPVESGAANGAESGGLLVEDDAAEVGPNQMRKGEFLAEVETAVCAAADAELAAVGQSTSGCPYVDKWLGYYRGRSSQQVEQALRRYAPGAAGAGSARDYIPLLAERVRQAVASWAKTGDVSDVPAEVAGIVQRELILSGQRGRVLAKGREGGVRENGDAQQIRSQLRGGSALDTSVRSKMESAFGHSFSNVRVHADSGAAGLSSRLNARAFTVGQDVAFGAGEYQPGTVLGDALIAHELAHVVQQGSASAEPGTMNLGDSGYSALEEDADLSAVGAVASLWGGAKGKLREIASNAGPRLRSGLRLSRCPKKKEEVKCPTQTVTMSGAKCGTQYGAVGTYCYSGATNWWFKENVKNGPGPLCQPGTIDQTSTPGQSPKTPSNCIDDLIFNGNGPPASVAPCTDTTFQTVFAGPTQATVEQCKYHNTQIIQVTQTPGSNPPSGEVITSSAGVSTKCSWP